MHIVIYIKYCTLRYNIANPRVYADLYTWTDLYSCLGYEEYNIKLAWIQEKYVCINRTVNLIIKYRPPVLVVGGASNIPELQKVVLSVAVVELHLHTATDGGWSIV